MSRLTFFLSGEHSSIPASEVIASIEAENWDYEIDEELDQVLTVETEADPLTLSRRLGMTHWISEHFCLPTPRILWKLWVGQICLIFSLSRRVYPSE